MWNHSQHLEAYMGAPVGGFVTHTLNLRLHPDDNTYIAARRRPRHPRPTRRCGRSPSSSSRCSFEHVIAVGAGPTPDGAIDYEDLLGERRRVRLLVPRSAREHGRGDVLHERHHRPPKGVLYSHRAIAIMR